MHRYRHDMGSLQLCAGQGKAGGVGAAWNSGHERFFAPPHLAEGHSLDLMASVRSPFECLRTNGGGTRIGGTGTGGTVAGGPGGW